MLVGGRSRDKCGDGDSDDKLKDTTTTTTTASNMKTMYSLLQSMVPGITPKASRENILFETTEYIKLLEKERARLENLKRTLDQLDSTDRASSPADGSSSSSRIQFAASSNIALFEIEASEGETSLTDIFNAIHQAGAEILMANITAREGRKRITVTAIVGDTLQELKDLNVEPGIVFHYGIPLGCSKFAYVPINTCCLNQFVENRGLLLSVTFSNQLEAMQRQVIQMKYTIPSEVSHGYQSASPGDTSVMFTLPQPLAESQLHNHGHRHHIILPCPSWFAGILILYEDGVMVLWDIQESKTIFTGGVMLSGHQEQRQVTSACWACPLGSKVAIGYSIRALKGTTETGLESGSQTVPLCKFNLGYKLDKVPKGSLKWLQRDANLTFAWHRELNCEMWHEFGFEPCN